MEIDRQKYPQPRTRHHTSSQFYLPFNQLQRDNENYPPLIENIHWQEYFANAQAPRALDIGCGWGKFLLDFAEAHPEINVLGLEARQGATTWLSTVIKGENIGNACALWYSVANGLDFLEPASLDYIFYFFPDPWFKRRHLKRRAFSPQFLDAIARLLAPNGALYLMTDVPAVDEYQCSLLEQDGRFNVELIQDDARWLGLHTDHELFSQRKNISYVRRICRLRS